MPRPGLYMTKAGPSMAVPNHLKFIFGQNARQLRQARGWSQETLADTIGTPAAHISRIELGQINLTLELMARIATALGGNVQNMLLPDERRSRWRLRN